MNKKDIKIRNGCCVRIDDTDFGIVSKVDSSNDYIWVQWFKKGKVKKEKEATLNCGFQIGMEVQDIPLSRTRKTLGEGTVIECRKIGNREQVLVDFLESGEKHWLPFQNLKLIEGIKQRFILNKIGGADNAERFRLRSLAYAIEIWNENTGSLSNLHIDPLPHQIMLVHHILKSGNLNWLIADDVGLGKTIEVGMLLSALMHRKDFRRILLITPAGLTRQWKDELHYKFGMNDFRIYGDDFVINEPREWKLYDNVIGSIDRFKSEQHVTVLIKSGKWDIVIFDEAHSLSRVQYGMKFESTERFRLAAGLRTQTDNILLLTATPHQGKQDKFQALLELLRPEYKTEIRNIGTAPEIIGEMVYRNNKSTVTDIEGQLIFRGMHSNSIPIDLTPEEIDFESQLVRYIKQGYEAGRKKGGMTGRAIGFVMTIYRKLAASSILAISTALKNRYTRLEKNIVDTEINSDFLNKVDIKYYESEFEENLNTSRAEFFIGEKAQLAELIKYTESILRMKNKISFFVDNIIKAIKNKNKKEKIVIFTEYIATQGALSHLLTEKYGFKSVSIINGNITHEEKRDAIEAFEDHGDFLISTEAGGEGINLHRKCHILINFDLPWNPMRIVQRIGRLYRYGQKKKVVVFNIFSPQSLDGSIMKLLYQRIDNVVRDMAILGGEFKPGLESEILGELAELIDIDEILKNSLQENLAQTEEKINQAIEEAKIAIKRQRDLLEYASGFDPESAADELKITIDHLKSFVKGMLVYTECKIVDQKYKGEVWKIELSKKVIDELKTKKQYLHITFNRDIALRIRDVSMMDLDNYFFQYLINSAKAYSFDGRVCSLKGLDKNAVVTAMLRWENDQGIRMRQEFFISLVDKDQSVETNSKEISEWLLKPSDVSNSQIKYPKDWNIRHFETALHSMDLRLSEICNTELHPENRQVISAAFVDR